MRENEINIVHSQRERKRERERERGREGERERAKDTSAVPQNGKT